MIHKITVAGKDYWYDIKYRQLYADEACKKDVNTKFFSHEDLTEFHKKTKDLINNDNKNK